MIARLVCLALLAPLLGACMQSFTGSLAGGECKIFEAPRYVVRGQAPYDQDWIDSQVEGGVGGCHWPRPAARPPELDQPEAPGARPAKQPAKKPGLMRRIRDRVRPPPPPAPAAAEWPAAAAPVLATPEPPPQPRSALDELLDPTPR